MSTCVQPQRKQKHKQQWRLYPNIAVHTPGSNPDIRNSNNSSLQSGNTYYHEQRTYAVCIAVQVGHLMNKRTSLDIMPDVYVLPIEQLMPELATAVTAKQNTARTHQPACACQKLLWGNIHYWILLKNGCQFHHQQFVPTRQWHHVFYAYRVYRNWQCLWTMHI